MSESTGHTFWVQGIVSARDREPYVQLSNDDRMIGQFTIAETRSIAFDLLRAASYAEADAMLMKFFQQMDFPEAAYAALMNEFRDFRHRLDVAKVNTSYGDADEKRD